MTTHVEAAPRRVSLAQLGTLPLATLVTATLFAVLFARPARLLVWDWWNNPEAGHGLLLAPLALYFAWKAGIDPAARPNRLLGISLILGGVFFRWVAALAAELFIMRGSMLMTAAGIIAWYFGFRQLIRWWLPLTLLALSIPLPELILSRVALPLQFVASKIGAALLTWREIPVLLRGNVISIPGHQLFVAEACSGLRSLTALISLGVLLSAITLRHPLTRALLVGSAIPVAILLNGFRVFLTGFLVIFVDPKLGEGFMHITEGWLIFLVAFVILGGLSWAFGRAERRVLDGPRPRTPRAEREEEVEVVYVDENGQVVDEYGRPLGEDGLPIETEAALESDPEPVPTGAGVAAPPHAVVTPTTEGAHA